MLTNQAAILNEILLNLTKHFNSYKQENDKNNYEIHQKKTND
jgi:hypothetical protein